MAKARIEIEDKKWTREQIIVNKIARQAYHEKGIITQQKLNELGEILDEHKDLILTNIDDYNETFKK